MGSTRTTRRSLHLKNSIEFFGTEEAREETEEAGVGAIAIASHSSEVIKINKGERAEAEWLTVRPERLADVSIPARFRPLVPSSLLERRREARDPRRKSSERNSRQVTSTTTKGTADRPTSRHLA